MSKIKKLILGLVTLTITAVLCAVCACAETYGDYEYAVLEDGTVEITDYTGSATELTIPAEINGKKVTGIDIIAFYNCTSLTSVTIPDGVTSIGNLAFEGCSSLISIDIPDSVTSIGNGAFVECAKLKSVTIPSGVTSIGDRTFEYCTSLESVTIPSDVTSIGHYAFYDCKVLKSIDIPSGVTSINVSTFYNCSSLESIDLPSGVTNIDKYAFYGCSSLVSINIPDGVASIGEYAFNECTALESITIPSGLPSIEEGVFCGCSSLTDVTIQNGIESIGDSAFAYCYDLTSVTIPTSVDSIGDGAFKYCSSLTSVEIPDRVTSIGEEAFIRCTLLESIEIPYCVTAINNATFTGCTALSSVTIPAGVKIIGTDAFNSCTSLTSVEISEGVTTIGDTAFMGCSSLTDVTIPDSITSIGCQAFDVTPFYKNQVGTFKYAGKWIINCYTTKETVTIGNDVVGIAEGAFVERKTITSITIPGNVKYIEDFAFAQCYNLESVTISSGTTKIGHKAFYNCSSLASIVIPDSVTSIGEKAIGYYYNFDTSKEEKNAGSIIYCVSGSAAETYAKENNIAYVLLDTVPNSVTGFKVSPKNSTSVTLSWTKNGTATGYIIELFDGSKWTQLTKITSNATTSYAATGLTPSVTYKFRIKAYNTSGGTTLYSAYTTASGRPYPKMMSSVTVKPKNSTSVTISWAKNTSATGYIIEVYKSTGWTQIAKITSNSTLSYAATGLTPSVTYKFRIKAYNTSGGTTLYSAYTTVSGRPYPKMMSNVKVSARTASTITLSWSKNTSATGYVIEQYKSGKWVQIKNITANSTISLKVSGLAKSTTHKFRIKAYNTSNGTTLYSAYTNINGTTTG